MRERRGLRIANATLHHGSHSLHPRRRAQLLEGRARLGELLLCLRVASLGQKPLAKLTASHRKPERALEFAERIDRGRESCAGCVAVPALSCNAGFPAKDVRVNRRKTPDTKVVSHQSQQLDDLGGLAEQEGCFHRLDERRSHSHRKGLFDAGAKSRLRRRKRQLVVTLCIRDGRANGIVLRAHLQLRVRDKWCALLDDTARRCGIAAKYVQPSGVDGDSSW